MSRRPDLGYIDQNAEEVSVAPAPDGLTGTATAEQDDQSSGSSVEEESDGEPFSDAEYGVGQGHIDPFDYEEDEEDDDWDVEGEDWELANGDFTKQYNRVRQQHAAGSGSVPLPARNAPQKSVPAKTKSQGNNISLKTGVATNPKAAQDKHDKDKSDRATQDQVLDSRTRLVLAGLVNRGVIGKIDRCISTGKEANVYFSPPSRVVKIYRTSILVFRSRQNYIVGEQRFKGEYTSSKNPRKMIRVWAEKELRNLKRLAQGGVRAPVVHECKENVLVMDYLGVGEEAAPRLKDAELLIESLPGLYAELMVATRRMYQRCHLVHADLSEYNILVHEGHLVIIDVSQSVEHDHPNAFDFLRSDLSNVEEFFGRRGTSTLGLRRSWEFVVTEDIGLSPEEEVGDDGEKRLAAIVAEWATEPSDKADDAVFMESYIPRTLAEVYDAERDVDVLKSGGGDDLIYAGITGLKLSQPTPDPPTKNVRFEDGIAAGASEDEGEGDNSEDEDEDGDKRPRGFRHEDRDSKKASAFRHRSGIWLTCILQERKKAVKEEQREKRKTKMPKQEKNRLVKKSSKR
ncbi:hypothetical protein B9479_002881 [Cryptococcus floricola]|uniref:Serine/threonine-protein kinase RIO1 n=1 Tax=Cryptococcus floricola TaxID=2591691 RepID=A0A5D3B081_9TREE|nr:hypothetical protein B9479_002881 [Cryptococcus floricola]